MKHLDLFSGIGGFAYAVDQVWPNSNHIFCDFDKFCQQVLKKHWPESLIYEDITAITNAEIKRLQGSNWAESEQSSRTRCSNGFDILTGGFPCQPFSAAGVRRGTADPRYLWPEMLRVIQLTKPTWVIAENVRGLLTWEQGVVFEQVCTDLENEGYEVQPFIIPALAVNAPHRRDRIWWVAFNAKYAGGGEQPRTTSSKTQKERLSERHEMGQPSKSDEIRIRNTKDSLSQRSRGRSKGSGQILERQSPEVQDQRPDWSSHWLEVATELCSVDDGLPVTLDGFKLSKPQSRKEQLKAYGNAIVPQVAIEIMKGIRYADQ